MANAIFKRTRQRYGETPVAVTPYQKAAQVWDERIGTSRAQAKNWRLSAFGTTSLSIILAATVAILSFRASAVPHVIEVARDGEVLRVAAAQPNYIPSDVQIAHHLEQFIENVRSVSSDDVVLRRNWTRAYDVVTDDAARGLNRWASDNDPFKANPRILTTVDVQSVNRASSETFELRWQETAVRDGRASDVTTHTALLGVALIPPTNERALQRNPLGIYIHTINWSQDRNSGDTP